MQLNRFTAARLCGIAAMGALGFQTLSQASEHTAGSEAVIHLASVEWAPYSSADLPAGGLASAVVAAAFSRAGKKLKVDFFPWKRTVMAGTTMSRYAGYFPLWHLDSREKDCYFSAPVAQTRIVLAYLRDAPVAPTRIEQLRDMRIGVVAGATNGERIDAMIADGQLKVEDGTNDDINVRKLLAGRLQLIVTEQRVLEYVVSGARITAAERERIAVADLLADERSVYVCFKRTPEGLKQRRQFDSALGKIDSAGIARDYMKAYAGKRP
jgi:polar amino acid transport system substrate-binding protein